MIEQSRCAEVLLTFLSTEGSLPSQHFFSYSWSALSSQPCVHMLCYWAWYIIHFTQSQCLPDLQRMGWKPAFEMGCESQSNRIFCKCYIVVNNGGGIRIDKSSQYLRCILITPLGTSMKLCTLLLVSSDGQVFLMVLAQFIWEMVVEDYCFISQPVPSDLR